MQAGDVRGLLVAGIVGLGLSLPARAEISSDAQALFEALSMSEVVQIMHEEGIGYGREIAADLFAGDPPAEWDALVAEIYNPERMEAEALQALSDATLNDDLGPIIAFFTSEPGQSFIELEISARRAFLDEELEAEAKATASMALMDQTPRAEQVGRFVRINDLVETNVTSALNSTYAFYLGLMDGGAFPSEMTEEDMIADVWSQEAEIRANTTEWVFGFLMMAYGPVSDEDIEAYISFSQTDGGKTLNRAVFGAFDGIFEGISMSLGRAAARYMVGQEL
jgi:hypothetical protein